MNLDAFVNKGNGFSEFLNKEAAMALKRYEPDIVILNKNRLNNTGTDIDGQSFGDYSPYSVKIKQAKGQTTSHVTLKDTGMFQENIVLKEIDVNKFEVTSEDIKWQFGVIQKQKYLKNTDNALGLSQKDADVISEKLAEDLVNVIAKYFS